MNRIYIKIIMFILICFNFSLYAVEKEKTYTSIETLIKNHSVSAKIIGLGGHSEECTEFQIQSLKKDTLYILIEPGRRLVSDDSTFQDILIIKKYEITLPPLASIILNGYGFCCQSSNSSPKKNALFKIGFMAPKTWVELAEYVNENNFPSSAIQNAVWVMSNNHPISSVHHENPEIVLPLKQKLAKLKKEELPWYSLTFVSDTSRLFTGEAEELFGKITYRVKNQSIISINIRNSEGKVVSTLVENVARGPGEYFVNIKIPVKNWTKGKYSVYIIEDYSNINTKKDFNL